MRARLPLPAANRHRFNRPTLKAGKPVKPYDLTVAVEPRYVAEQSNPGEQEYVFAYTVRITNTGEHPAQVISRHWIITDGNQRVREVRGLGVVGQQPLLAPGETFVH
jgi:ApaG protein